jgi:hypothetical protein
MFSKVLSSVSLRNSPIRILFDKLTFSPTLTSEIGPAVHTVSCGVRMRAYVYPPESIVSTISPSIRDEASSDAVCDVSTDVSEPCATSSLVESPPPQPHAISEKVTDTAKATLTPVLNL